MISGTTSARSSAGTVTVARAFVHTGYGATNLVFHIGMGLVSAPGVTATPRVDVTCTISGGAATTESVFYGINSGGVVTDAPDEIAYHVVKVAVSPATNYEVLVQAFSYARVLSISCYEEASNEIDTAVDYFANPHAAVGGPIVDITRQEILQGLSQLWRRNGPMLMCWPGETTDPTNATTTWTNVIDSTTAVAASSAGWFIAGDGDETGEMLCRLSDAKAFDAVLAVYSSMSGAATGEVRFQDAGGTICSVTGLGAAAGWRTQAVTIAGTDALGKCDLQFRTSNVASTITIHAVSLFAFLT